MPAARRCRNLWACPGAPQRVCVCFQRMPEGGGEAPLEGAGRGRQVLPLAATQSLGAAAAGGAGRAAVLAAHPEGPAGVCPCSALRVGGRHPWVPWGQPRSVGW